MTRLQILYAENCIREGYNENNLVTYSKNLFGHHGDVHEYALKIPYKTLDEIDFVIMKRIGKALKLLEGLAVDSDRVQNLEFKDNKFMTLDVLMEFYYNNEKSKEELEKLRERLESYIFLNRVSLEINFDDKENCLMTYQRFGWTPLGEEIQINDRNEKMFMEIKQKIEELTACRKTIFV